MALRVRLGKLLEYAREAGYSVERRGDLLELSFSPPPSTQWRGGAAIKVYFRVEDGYALLFKAALETEDGAEPIDEELLEPWLLCVDPEADRKQ